MSNSSKLITSRKTLDLSKRTIIMGVLNVTPDSFFDGGKYFSVEKAVEHARQMVEEGVDIIDIGGESTASYTGVKNISAKEELQRVMPVITAIRKSLDKNIILSIDTYKSEVAKRAIEAGADIINDPSGLQLDSKMPEIVKETAANIIINHMQGNINTMFHETFQHIDVIQDILNFFIEKVALLEKLGVSRDKIILDPGFGFRKKVKHNIEVLNRLKELEKFHLPIMIGISKKSTIGKLLSQEFGREFPPEERLEGSLAATAIAVLNGANIVRVHDVLETRKFFAVFDRIRAS